MFRYLLLSASLLAASVLGSAQAATSNRVIQATMSVASSCVISSVTDMNFGAYNPTLNNNAKDATNRVSVTCTALSPGVRVAFDEGQHAAAGSSCSAPRRRLARTDGSFLSYQLYSNSARSSVLGCSPTVNDVLLPESSFTTSETVVSITQYGRIAAGQDVSASTAPFVDVIGVTVSF